MGSKQLQYQVASMRDTLFKQGYLDEQFVQLEELQDDDNPNFVEDIVKSFFQDSVRSFNNIEKAMESHPFDFEKLDKYMHQFKGSSSSIGAAKIKEESTMFREYCRQGSAEGCLRTFQQLKKEHAILRKKLETYFQLARQAGPTETACRSK
ncbi:hypothetical protein IFM89_011501 [Coptis chinensis]|uniref:Histidine-containing phosphotransfer protein n=1 Tax=Coptis chinensis TaxID=261450 RepID=A0A835M2B0_9MAGN|nr:hypothetical protein IFM89_011501 [Coptis chinensis]